MLEPGIRIWVPDQALAEVPRCRWDLGRRPSQAGQRVGLLEKAWLLVGTCETDL